MVPSLPSTIFLILTKKFLYTSLWIVFTSGVRYEQNSFFIPVFIRKYMETMCIFSIEEEKWPIKRFSVIFDNSHFFVFAYIWGSYQIFENLKNTGLMIIKILFEWVVS